nr:fused MFS/spermidine synthase [Planctomycetota bacterium]
TWSSVLATFLGGIALGNAWGGRRADRATAWTLPIVLFAAAACVAVSPWLDGLARSLLGGLGHGLRVPVTVLLVFLPAAFAMGLPAPFYGKAVLGTGRPAGRALGEVAAAGALGSVAGTFLTGFALIPSFGTRTLLLVLAGILAAAGLAARALAIHTRTDGNAAEGDQTALARRWPVLAAAAGFALLALEIAAGRVAAIHLGTSVYTWTAVIGVVLIGLSVGNVVGGRLADRYPVRPLLGTLFLIASATTATALWTPNLMGRVADGGGAWTLRVAAAVAVGFLLPSLAIGTLSPVIVRGALEDPKTDGRVVGRIYAWGTLGAVAGALLAPYVLIPWFSLPVLVIAIAFGLAVAAIPLRGALELPWLVTLVLLALLVRLPIDALRTTGNRLGLREDVPGIYVDDSRYFHIVVAPYERPADAPARAGSDEGGAMRYMALDRLVHGFVDLADPLWLEYEYERLYAAIVERLWPSDADRPIACCFIGGGTYTYQRRLLAQHPASLALHTIEIDPAVTEAARNALGLQIDPRHRIVHADARTELARDELANRFDFVFGDAFHDVGVPWHLTTRECTALVRSRLRKGTGVYLVNIVDIFASGRFLGAFLRTLEAEFEHVVVLSMGERKDHERQTFILAASDLPLALDGLTDDTGAPLADVHYGPEDLALLRKRAGVPVLTDDHAPVEALLAPVIEKRRMSDER